MNVARKKTNGSIEMYSLISEINKEGVELGYFNKYTKIENMTQIDIKKIIAKIEAKTKSDSFLHITLAVITLMISLTGTVILTSPKEYTLIEFSVFFAGLSIETFVLLWATLNLRKNSYRKIHFKELLMIYLQEKC